MLKPPAPTIPGMTDTLDFVKNLWGSMNIPGAGLSGMAGIAKPPLTTDDLDKRIADLKAVESWLNLNLTMLRGTIQPMEVQRGTLVTLKTMGASMAEVMRQSGVSAEKMASMPFAPFFSAQGQGGAGTDKPAAAPSTPTPPPPGLAPSSATPGPSAAGGGTAQPGTALPQGSDAAVAAAAAAMGMPAAMAWWNMLQEQFTQAVTTAMASAAPAASPAPGKASNGAAKAKPEATKPGAQAGGETPNGANGKARSSRSKADKA